MNDAIRKQLADAGRRVRASQEAIRACKRSTWQPPMPNGHLSTALRELEAVAVTLDVLSRRRGRRSTR